MDKNHVSELVAKMIKISINDWDSYEISWDFRKSPLLDDINSPELKNEVNDYLNKCAKITDSALELEVEINKHFINGFGLADTINGDPTKKKHNVKCKPSI